MQMLDATIIATALPAMAASLGVPPVRLNVAITAYLLAVAVFVPLSGWLADRVGARRVFVFAIGLFAFSSLLCGVSQELWQLVAARVLQGFAGALMVPVGRIVLLRSVPKAQLMGAMSFLTIPALVGPVLGPPIGGFLVTYASWHWVFLINLPIGIIGITLVLRYLPEVSRPAARPLDVLGLILSGVSLATLVLSFDVIGHGIMPWYGVLALIGTGLLSGGLYLLHARRTAHPILDLSLFRIHTFSASTLGGNLSRLAIGATPFLLTMQLQVVFGMTPLAAGLLSFTGAAGALMMKFTAAPIIRLFGFRRTLMVNAVLSGLGVLAIALFGASSAHWVIMVVLLVAGFLRSLQLTGVNTLTYADVTPERMSQASGLASVAQQLAISLGVGIAALSLNLSMAWRGAETLARPDLVVGYVVIALLTMSSALAFRTLPPQAGAELNQR
jgi:EmrB/QacA subfamily drug resistance transporter